MNAHKFVAEYGIEEAKRVLSGAPKNSNWFQEKGKYSNDLFSCNHEIYGEAVMLSELKQVVESVEIVDQLGGIKQSKSIVDDAPEDCCGYHTMYEGYFFESNKHNYVNLRTFEITKIEKAIADYELVESYKQVKVEVGFGIALQSNQSIGAKCEVLDMVDVSPRCGVINETH